MVKTVKFYPHKNPIPEIVKEEAILIAANNILEALKEQNDSLAIPDSTTTGQELHHLAGIFSHRTKRSTEKIPSSKA